MNQILRDDLFNSLKMIFPILIDKVVKIDLMNVIRFHLLEDRIFKKFFKQMQGK
jgi:16S rRNA C1402 N4-methylase RsmH